VITSKFSFKHYLLFKLSMVRYFGSIIS